MTCHIDSPRDTHCNLSHIATTLQPTCHTGPHTATNLSHRDTHCNVSHRTHGTLIHNNTRLTFEIPISFMTKSFPESFCLTRRALPNEPSPIFFTRSNLSITRAAVEGGTINTPFCDRLRAHTYFYCQTTSHAHMHVSTHRMARRLQCMQLGEDLRCKNAQLVQKTQETVAVFAALFGGEIVAQYCFRACVCMN